VGRTNSRYSDSNSASSIQPGTAYARPTPS
jgi:hypothetical protein